MLNPKNANLTDKELKSVLLAFPGKQMRRVIKGICDNPSILTHDVSGSFYCNNVSDIRQKAADRLLRHGLKLLCVPPNNPNAITKSHHWFMCHVGEIEVLEVQAAANDEAFL